MPFFGRKQATQDPADPMLTEFLGIAAGLSADEAARVEAAAVQSGFVTGRDLQVAVGMIISAGFAQKLDGARKKAQKAGSNAIQSGPGAGGRYPVLAYAAGVTAEAIVLRMAIDPKTWAFATGPWRTIFEIPPLYEGDEPELIRKARETRAAIE
jgi:hypothetical protein